MLFDKDFGAIFLTKKTIIIVLVLIMFLFVTGKTYKWQKQNARFASGFDQMATVAFTTQAYLYLLTGDYFNYFPEGFQEANRNPPIPFYAGAIAMTLFGASFHIMSLINLLFFFALCGAVFVLGTRRGGAYIGLIAVGFLLLTRAMVQYLCVWNTDMAGSAMVAWTMVMLDDATLYKSKLKMILLGCLIAIGSLTRMTVLLFLWFPMAYVIIKSLIPATRIKNYKHLGIICWHWILALISFRLILMIPQRQYLLFDELRSEIPIAGDKYRHFFTLEDIPFYLNWWNNIGPILLVAGGLGLILSAIRDRNNFWLPFIWFIVPMVAFSYFSVNATRLLLPAIPALALFGAMLFRCENRKIISAAAIIFTFFALSQFGTLINTPNLTTPPTVGAGWEEYDATDLEIVDKFYGNSKGVIVFLEFDRTRQFSHHMLPSTIVFQNPERPFFRFHYESSIKDLARIAGNFANSNESISTIIVRHLADMEDVWNHEKYHEFWKMTRMVGANENDFDFFITTLEKLLSSVRTQEPAWDKIYEYGKMPYRVRVYSK